MKSTLLLTLASLSLLAASQPLPPLPRWANPTPAPSPVSAPAPSPVEYFGDIYNGDDSEKRSADASPDMPLTRVSPVPKGTREVVQVRSTKYFGDIYSEGGDEKVKRDTKYFGDIYSDGGDEKIKRDVKYFGDVYGDGGDEKI